MGKKFRGELCSYCRQKPAENMDHVFARQFFTASDRGDLPKVPACNCCNNEKSVLEHYVCTALPFGSRLERGAEMLYERVAPRLAKNRPLMKQLREGYSQRLILTTLGLQATDDTLPFDFTRFERLIELFVRGLSTFHWNMPLAAADNINVTFLTTRGEAFFDQLVRAPDERTIRCDLNGVFQYEGVRSRGHPHITAWKFYFYGGAMFAGDSGIQEDTSRCVGVLTGPQPKPALTPTPWTP